MENQDILFKELQGKNGKIGLVTLNRQKALNAITHEMFKLLGEKLKKWQIDSNIKAVVVTAAEGRAFCAGGDVRKVYQKKISSDPEIESYFHDEYEINRLIHHYSKPYIAFLDGITMGGGAGISIHGSHRVATENMVFAMPETTIGFFPDVGASYFLSRLPYNMGRYLGLLGATIKFSDAYELGLIDYVVSSEKINEIINALKETELKDHNAVSQILEKFHKPAVKSELLQHKELIESSFSHGTVEEIIKSLESSNEFGKKAAEIIKTKSPTSLKVALREIIAAESMSFDDCMDVEYKIMQQCLKSPDFFEGVRALLVDKDKDPKWQPASLSEVSESLVAKFFLHKNNAHSVT